VIDASPAQGEFMKACLSSRTKAVAICGTESHCARLELLLTDFVLSELSREGSTFYRPDAMSKDEEDTHEGKGGAGTKAVPKKGPKKRQDKAKSLSPSPRRARNRRSVRPTKRTKKLPKKSSSPRRRSPRRRPRTRTKRMATSHLSFGEERPRQFAGVSWLSV
jgi:hypothetical protein